jgi:hypothetical protein
MIATVDVADLGTATTLRSLRRRPKAVAVPGLRWADVAVAAPLATSRPPSAARAALLAFWDDEDAADSTASHALRERFADGFHMLLRPLRAHGTWPGLPADLPSARRIDHDGPVAVLTLGRLRLSQFVRFVRSSRPAERSATTASGLLWGTAAARPPFVATISLWADSDATAAYAYSQELPQHSNAIAAQRRKDFHRQSAFVRFAPIAIEGALEGANPVSATALAG